MPDFVLGLLGKNIAYSASQQLFTEKFQHLGLTNWRYEVLDLPDKSLIPSLFATPGLLGFNVTIPYKQEIIPFLDELSPEAAAVGAVNTVVKEGGRWVGANTDVHGFQKSLELHLGKRPQRALILGDGGAAKAVRHVLNGLEIPHQTFSRQGPNRLEDLTDTLVAAHPLVVQTTPVGTFPDVENHLPFPFSGLSGDHLVMDLIYNPPKTAFLRKAEAQGAKVVNGWEMLTGQAEKSWELWQAAATKL